MKNILVVSSFMADTYSRIENNFVKMSLDLKDEFNFIWLVRDPLSPMERYKDESQRGKLSQAKYVEALEKEGITYVKGELSKWNLLSNGLLLHKIFKEYQIDGVYTHFHFEKYHACFWGKILGKKVIHNEHMYYDAKQQGWKTKLRAWFFNTFTDVILSVSKGTGKLFRPSKTRVVLNSVDIDEFSLSDKTLAKERIGQSPEKKIILMVAAYRPEKRHDLAYQIAEKVLAKDKDSIFIFIGSGETMDSFKDHPLVKKYPHRVIQTGHLSDLKDYYNGAELTMITSEREAFGYVLIESMAYEVPALSFQGIGGPDEIISEGENGYLIPAFDLDRYADKILELLTNPRLREELGKNGRESVIRKFGYDRWISEMRGVFSFVMDGKEG